MSQILVTGGTGKTGRRVVQQLTAAGVPVRVGSRSGTPPFDWTAPNTWDAALDGVASVFVVPHETEPTTRPFIRRCLETGVRRVVLLSGRGVDVPGYADLESPMAHVHVDGEAAVRASGLEWTIVRPTWFAQNFTEGFFRDAVLAGEIRLPAGKGAVPYVDAEDIAAVAVAALTEDTHHGQTYELSGPHALTFDEVTAEISRATGRTVRYVPLSEEEFIAELVTEGWSPAEASDYAAVISPIRHDLETPISDGVHRALGRPPLDFTTFTRTAWAT
ncbi:NAD(P)H-binding protein [Actinokineospora auranticolor]|nr:NAD(P)H-binding protein [Actinokineospora auranticolor]